MDMDKDSNKQNDRSNENIVCNVGKQTQKQQQAEQSEQLDTVRTEKKYDNNNENESKGKASGNDDISDASEQQQPQPPPPNSGNDNDNEAKEFDVDGAIGKIKARLGKNFSQFEKACCKESDAYVKLLKGFGFGGVDGYDPTQMLLIKIEVESIVEKRNQSNGM